MKKIFLFLIISLSTLLIVSCKHETLPPSDVGYSYFPVNTGHWVIYDVDSTAWDGFIPDTSAGHMKHYHYYIKEIVESEYYDNEGRLTQRLERYQKLCDTCDWFIKDVWAVNLTPSTAEKVEENYRIVKMAFPIDGSITWNGNAFISGESYILFSSNTFGEQEYEYEDIFEPKTINGLSFDSTVKVIERPVTDTNAIEAYNQYAIYARNVGMVFRHYRAVSLEIPYAVKAGADYTYKIISYGNQ